MTIEQRIKRWKDFYDDRTGETRILYMIDYEQGNGQNWPSLCPENKDARIEWAWKNYRDGMERIKWLEDDYLPYLSVISGTEIFAEALGAKVFRPKDNMPCALPFIFSPEDAEKVKIPRLEDTPLMDLFDIADELKRRGGSEALLKLPDIQSPMDIVAQIWDKSDLFPSMIEEPEVVKELSEKIKLLLFEFFDCWFRKYGTSYIAHHPDYYMEGGITLSADEIGNVSSEMFTEFFAQELNELSLRYGGIGIHCCAESKHQWENLKNVKGLKLLNLYRPESILDESYAYFCATTAMWPGKMEHNIPEPLHNKRKSDYPKGSRLILVEKADTKEDALRLAEILKKEYR